MFFRLYLVMDIYSRKIVAWEVHESESAEHAATLIEKACWAEHITDEGSHHACEASEARHHALV